MKAIRFWAPQDVRVENVAERDPGPGEVLIDIEAALTCGTDAKCYKRGHPVLLGPLPARFGHEYAGVVVAAGDGAPFREGDRVCGANSAPCGACRPCKLDREELCEALYPLLNGAYAERLLIPSRIAKINLHRVPDGIDMAVAASLEPFACAIHAAEDAGAGPGVRVGVVGTGPLGRMIVTACRARGADCDLLGRGEGEPRSYAAVVEAAGTLDAWRSAIELTEPGGTVLVFGGVPRGTEFAVDTYRLHYEALTLRGTFHHRPRDVRAALELIASDPAPVAALLTHEYGLAEVAEPLRRTCGLAPRDGLLKAVIRP